MGALMRQPDIDLSLKSLHAHAVRGRHVRDLQQQHLQQLLTQRLSGPNPYLTSIGPQQQFHDNLPA